MDIRITKNDEQRKSITGILLMGLMLLAILTIPGILTKPFGYSLKTLLIATRILYWVCLLLMFVYTFRIERKPFLLWNESRRTVGFYLLAILAIAGILITGLSVINLILTKVLHINQPNTKMNLLLSLFRKNRWLLFATAITAGVVEEFLFRGYLIPRLQILLKSTNWSIFISSALFGLMHFSYGTIAQVIGPFYIGLIFALFYQKYRNIKVVIICHIIWDILAIVALISHNK